MPLERLTMLVAHRDGEATLVVPTLGAPTGGRAARSVRDPALGRDRRSGGDRRRDRREGGDRRDRRHDVGEVPARPAARDAIDVLLGAVEVTGALRAQKDDSEIEALRRAGAAADRVATALQSGEIALVGRTEAAVSAEISARLLAEGHHQVNFAIVAAGENAASPHHDASDRIIRSGEVVLCDFGGTLDGYCSDITRCVSLGAPSSEVHDAYDVLFEAQASAVKAAVVGTPCEDVDAAARSIIAGAGYGPQFIHRTGHGIGVEAHEDPYIVEGNEQRLAPGHTFSIEPGIYVAGRFGLRLEDIVVATEEGPDRDEPRRSRARRRRRLTGTSEGRRRRVG